MLLYITTIFRNINYITYIVLYYIIKIYYHYITLLLYNNIYYKRYLCDGLQLVLYVNIKQLQHWKIHNKSSYFKISASFRSPDELFSLVMSHHLHHQDNQIFQRYLSWGMSPLCSGLCTLDGSHWSLLVMLVLPSLHLH